MSLLPFDKLPVHSPRQFVPANADLGNWSEIEPLFNKLEEGIARISSSADLERWLKNWSELSAALDEESSKRYIAMTCHTDDPEAEKAYLEFVEKIDPQIKPRQFKLAQLYVRHPIRKLLSEDRYKVFDRDTKLLVELFRPEN